MSNLNAITLAQASELARTEPNRIPEIVAVLNARIARDPTSGKARRAAAWIAEATASGRVPDAKRILNDHFAFMRKPAQPRRVPVNLANVVNAQPAFTKVEPTLPQAKPERLTLKRLDARIDGIEGRLVRVEAMLSLAKAA